MKKGVCQRAISMMVVICMILTICPVTVMAEHEGEVNTITAGQLVAGAYSDLSQAEKELIRSGLLPDVTYEYHVPGEENDLIEVDTEKKTVSAKSWTDDHGNVWNPVGADVVVNGSAVETVMPNGEDTYEYDGNAFSVRVAYELYLTVDAELQKQMLNTAGWLKDGVANLDTIAAQSTNMAALEEAMPRLMELRDMEVTVFVPPVGETTVSLKEEYKAVITELDAQMAAHGGKLTLHAMMLDYLTGSRVEFLLKNGSKARAEIPVLLSDVDRVLELVDTLLNEPMYTQFGFVDDDTRLLVSILGEKLESLESGLTSAANGDWTAAEKGTALVKEGITTAEYVALDALVAALGEVKSAEDFVIDERFLAAETTIQHNLSMKNITVQVKLEVVEDAVDSDKLVSGGEMKQVVLTLAEDATKAEMEAALAETTVEEEALAAWGDAYVEEHFVRSTTELPETLTKDIIYTITYRPATYTITYAYDEGTTTKDVPYGYQTVLELYPDSEKVYDYTVNGEYQPQGSVCTILGNVTISRQTGKPYTSADLYTIIANMDGISEKEKAVLTAGALQGNTTIINVRYPDTNSGSLVAVDADFVLSGKTYASDYKGLIWVPYSYVVTAGDGTDYELAYFQQEGDRYTAQITDPNFREIKVYYRLQLTNLGENAAQDALDLVAQLVQEVKSQNTGLASLSSENMSSNLGMLDALILDTLKGLISRNTLHANAAKDTLLKECFTNVIGKIEDNCLEPGGAPRIALLIDAYVNSGKSLAYYYRNSESFLTEVALLSRYLDEMLLADANLTADEKLSALRTLIDKAPSDIIPDEKVEEYTRRLPDLQEKMSLINEKLLPVNEAVDTTSPNLNKLLNALETEGDVGTQCSDYVYLQSQSFNVAGSGKVVLKINVICGTDERSVSETVDQNEPVPQDAIDSLKEKVAALRAEMGIVDDPWYRYECEEYADGAALDELVDQAYANNQIISFTWVRIERTPCERGEHTEEILPAVEPTCTETGLTEGKKCTVCGETTVPQQEVPATGHTNQILPAVAPTCTATGLTEGLKCSVCHEVLVPQEVVDALGHNFTGEWVKDEIGHWHECLRGCGAIDSVVAHSYDTNNCAAEAHCTICSYTKAAGQHAWGPLVRVDDAEHKQICSSCQAEQKNPHSWTLVAEESATCETDGYKKYTCSCTAEKTDVQNSLGHSWSPWTRLNAEQHTRVCSNNTTEHCRQTAAHTWDAGVLNEDGDLLYTCTAECGATKLVIQNKEGKLEAGTTIKAQLTASQDGSVVLPKPKADGFEGPGYRYDYVINGVTYKVTNDSESYPIYPGSVADATVKLVNMDNEKLELLVKAMGGVAQLEKDPGLKITNDGYYTGLKVEADTNGVMRVVTALIQQDGLGTGKYGYVAVGDEPLLHNNKVSMLGLLRMVMGEDGKYTSQDIIDLSDGTNMCLISDRLVLRAAAPGMRAIAANDGHDLKFSVRLTEAPDEVEKVGAALNKVKNYITFDIKPAYDNGVLVSNGLDIDVKANLPEKIYEIYLVALRLSGKVDVNNANEVEAEVSYLFLQDYINVLLGADVTTTTLMNTAAKLGKTVDLSEYENLFNALKGRLGYGQNVSYSNDGMAAFTTLDNKDMELVVDRMEPMVDDAEMLDILKSMMVECQPGETVDVTLNGFVVNFADGDGDGFIDTNYEAIILDVGAAKKPGLQKADVFDITEDLATSVAGFQSAAAIMLQKDVAADLHFKHATILDLNGHTIDGAIAADAKLIILDSTLATATVGGVTGAITGSDVTILAGTYGRDVSAYLKDGYVQQSGTVKNEYYKIKKVGNDITFEVDADILANRELPSVWLAGDMTGDLAMNYFTAAALAFADSDDVNAQNPYSIYAIVFDDLVGLVSDTVNRENINALIDILKHAGSSGIKEIANDLAVLISNIVDEERINEVLDILKLSGAGGIEGFLNDLMAKSMDFGALAEAIDNNTEIIKYNMVAAPWSIKLGTVAGEDYLTVGIEPGEDVIGSVAVTVVGTQANKDKIADVLAEMGKIMATAKNSVTVTLQDPVYADKTLAVSGGGSVAIDIDMSQNSDYAAITAVALASSGVKKAEFIDALNAYFADRSDTDALYETLSEVTLAQYINAVKNPDIIDGFSDMLVDLGVASGAGSSAVQLGDTYRMALVAVGRVLAKLNIDGNSRVVFGPTGKINYANSGITRNITRTAADVTVSVTATVESISAVVKLFPDTTCVHNYVPVVTPPTCEDQGYTTYTCSKCGDSYVDSYVDAIGHDWNDPVYTFAADGSSCTAERVCKNDGTHIETATATITSAVKTPAGCESVGTTTYTATFTETWAVTQIKDVDDIPATDHDWNDPVYTFAADGSSCTAERVCKNDANHKETATATITSAVKTPAGCESVGTTTYTATFTETWAVTQIKDVDDIPATDHDWNDPVYTFAADGSSCTAERVCKNDSTHIETATATITSAVKTPAGCESVGTTTYTATFTESWAATQIKDVADIPAIGHNWTWVNLYNGKHKGVCDATNPAHEVIENHVDANNDKRCDKCNASLSSGGGGGGFVSTKYEIEVTETENGTVTLNTNKAAKDAKITITVAPDAGYKVIQVIVTQNGNGAKCEVTAVSGTEYTFRMPGDAVTITVIFECNGDETLCPSRHLTDVDRTQWYHIAVDYVVVNHLMGGIGNNLFAPNAAMDRAMIVQVLYNQERTPAVEYTGKFPDVPDGKWYTDAVEWGVANHLISGYGDGEFKPERKVSREEIATILYNYAKFKGVDTSVRGDLSKFSDGDTVSAWATHFMQWAVGSGLMAGDGIKLNPTQTAIRAEVAQMFKNFNEIFGLLK